MAINRMNENSFQTKYLAQNLTDARDLSGKSVKEVSSVLGIPTSRLKNYENGKHIPSLPELESLSYLLRIPISLFFQENGVTNFVHNPNNEQLVKLIGIRQQIIGTKIHLYREAANKTAKDLAKQISIPASRLKRYEEGTSEIPLNELNSILEALDLDSGDFLDLKSPIGEWQNSQSNFVAFKKLPDEIIKFVSNSENLKFLLVAKEISKIGIQKIHDLSSALSDFLNSVDDIK